jgi:tetratricopeptide (TPR) repeat protein
MNSASVIRLLSRRRRGLGARRVVASLLLPLLLLYSLRAQAEEAARDQDLFNQGKILMFDKKWEEARELFQRVIREFPKSNLVPQAHYFAARSLQQQGKEEEAIRAYDEFTRRYPGDSYLLAEARNSVVDLAASLMEKGNSSYRDRIVAALGDPTREIRYFAAIRSSSLNDRGITSMAVPVLRQIIDKEKERDLVDRAKIALLRLDPNALSPQRESPERGKNEGQLETRMFHIRVYSGDATEPTVEVNLPVSFAQLAIMALDESKKMELRRKGFNVDDFWESIKRLGPTKILEIHDGKDLVKIWIE